MFAGIDAWAIPLNTFLLVALALVNAYIARTTREERRNVQDVMRSLALNKRKRQVRDTGQRRRATDKSQERDTV